MFLINIPIAAAGFACALPLVPDSKNPSVQRPDVLTQFLQFQLGYTPLQAGVRMLPAAGAIALVGPASSALVRAFGTKVTIAAGLLIAGAGL